MCAGLTQAELPSPVIAVDGGGTRCRLVLDRGPGPAGGRVSVETGPANVTSDFDAALGEIRRGLDQPEISVDTIIEELTSVADRILPFRECGGGLFDAGLGQGHVRVGGG